MEFETNIEHLQSIFQLTTGIINKIMENRLKMPFHLGMELYIFNSLIRLKLNSASQALSSFAPYCNRIRPAAMTTKRSIHLYNHKFITHNMHYL